MNMNNGVGFKIRCFVLSQSGCFSFVSVSPICGIGSTVSIEAFFSFSLGILPKRHVAPLDLLGLLVQWLPLNLCREWWWMLHLVQFFLCEDSLWLYWCGSSVHLSHLLYFSTRWRWLLSLGRHWSQCQ